MARGGGGRRQGFILVAGGCEGEGGRSRRVEALDVARRRWARAPDLTMPRAALALALA